MCVKLVFILTFLMKKNYGVLKIYFLKGEESLSAEMEIVSTEMMLFRGMK